MNLELLDARMLNPLVAFLERNGARRGSFLDRARIPGELIAEGGWITKKQAMPGCSTACALRRRHQLNGGWG
jgi:hypothetical protein